MNKNQDHGYFWGKRMNGKGSKGTSLRIGNVLDHEWGMG